MKQFKKRTIALVLASVVTVVGSFAAEKYKNSLMALKFENSSDNSINMILETRTAYSGNVTPIKKDAGTYVLMLPEINSLAPTPDIVSVSGNIANVNIRTMPYSSNAKGYTRITIKTTNPVVNLVGQNKIFVPSAQPETRMLPGSTQNQASNSQAMEPNQEDNYYQSGRQEAVDVPQSNQEDLSPMRDEIVERKQTVKTDSLKEKEQKEAVLSAEEAVAFKNETDSANTLFLICLAILIILCSAYFYVRAKNKMREIAGESFDIEVDEPVKKESKRKKIRKIKNTINSLDNTYRSPISGLKRSEYTVSEPEQTAPPIEEINVVDLDELFQEQKEKEETGEKTIEDEENDALEDFLSGFSFNDEDFDAPIEEEEPDLYNEELFEKVVGNLDLNFSNDDIECINQLLKTEINDDTMRNIAKYAISNPIEKTVPRQKILEDLVMTYTISHNITFNQEDINALNKLINVEIDSDFVTDLRTNPERLKEMQQDFENRAGKSKKPSEILTLNVKDMLPNLSEALKKQGNKQIESNYKPDIVYYSEGYDVRTLSLDDSLPDLSVEVNSKSVYNSKPSAEIQYVDNSYDVQRLTISSQLPDLKDALAHPEKYEKEEVSEVFVDEETLLNNISNVQFKPFYDGSEDFEVINDFDTENTPSVSDIQKEFSQFGNFEIAEEEPVTQDTVQEEHDDFKSLYSEEYVNLDEEIKNTVQEKQPSKKEFTDDIGLLQKPRNAEKSVKRARPAISESLLQKIEQTRKERELRKARINVKQKTQEVASVQNEVFKEQKGFLDGEAFIIVSSVIIQDNIGCHLVKNDKGYAVLAYAGDRLTKIKTYDELRSEKIQARLSEELEDGSKRYIVRIGANKFVVNLKDANVEHVIDLC